MSPDKSAINKAPECGRLVWIGIRPEKKVPIRSVEEVWVDRLNGLRGDHAGASTRHKRQVTLLQAEHLAAMSVILQRKIPPELLRRNLLIRGISLQSLAFGLFRVGEVVLRATGPCQPCRRMELVLGPEGLKAMRGRGGITATVIRGGLIRRGDEVSPLQDDLFGAWQEEQDLPL